MSANDDEYAGQVAVVSIGGGHHPHRFERLILECEHLLAGHIIPSYFLKYGNEAAARAGDEVADGHWKHTVTEAIESTRRAFPDAEVWVFLDWKSLRGWQKPPLLALLDELGVPWGKRANDFPSGGEMHA